MAALYASAGCYAGTEGDQDSGETHAESTGAITSASESTDDGEPDEPTGDAPAIQYCWDVDARCVSPAPHGWIGPFALYDGDIDEAPACPSELATRLLDGHDDLQPAAAAQCACACGAAEGGTCGAVPLTAYQMPDIGACGGCTSDYAVPANTCVEVLACGDPLGSIVMQAAPAVGGACVPSAPDVELAPLEWGRVKIGCAGAPLDLPGCVDTQQCMPRAGAPFEPELCISHAGDVACTEPPYVHKRSAWLGAADTRGCAACTCAPAQGATCHGSLTLFHSNSPGCSLPEVVYEVPQDCTWKSIHTAVMVALYPPEGGSCAPGGGEPQGSASPDMPVTVCCAVEDEPGPVE